MTAKQQGWEGCPRQSWPLGQQGFNVRLIGSGWKVVAVPAHGQTIWAHQVLLEVSGDVVASPWRPGVKLGVGQERSGIMTGGRQRLL